MDYQTKPSITPLTFVRFIAAFYVFLFHIYLHWTWNVKPFISNIVNEGAVGMSLFFILSGFILTYNYYDKKPLENYRYFIVKRLARIYPVYLLAMILFLPRLWIELVGSHLVVLGKTLFLFFTNIFLIQAWYPVTFFLWNDGASWSLSVEMFCYLLFPLLIVAMGRLSFPKLILLSVTAYVLTILPGVATILFDIKPLISTTYALPMYRLPEFIVGMIMCYVFLRYKLSHRNLLLILSATTGIILLWLGFNVCNYPYFVNNNVIIIPGFAIIIYCLANLQKGLLYKIFCNRVAIFLGDISYSFYLLQGFVFLPVSKYFKYFSGHVFFANNTMTTLTLFTVTLIISAASYLLIEKPCRRYIVKRFAVKKDSDVTVVTPLPSLPST